MMESVPVSGLTLFFEAEERDGAESVRQACEKSVRLIHRSWGLETPGDCRVYIMTSWLRAPFQSAPWPWKVLLVLLLPFWAPRARKVWPYAGGWEQQYGDRRTVGVKPTRLITLGDSSIGDRIFVPEEDVTAKVQGVTCHELVHAFSSHLGLPAWLKEGLAMVTVDRFFERATVRHETLEALERSSPETSTGGREKLPVGDQDALVYQYVRGYWLTRYLEETRPGLLKGLLSRRYSRDELEGEVATAYGKEREEFWDEIDREIVSHFNRSGTVADRAPAMV